MEKTVGYCREMVLDVMHHQVTANGKKSETVAGKIQAAEGAGVGARQNIDLFRVTGAFYGKSDKKDNHYFRQYIMCLRRKLGDDPVHPWYILGGASVGYRLVI